MAILFATTSLPLPSCLSFGYFRSRIRPQPRFRLRQMATAEEAQKAIEMFDGQDFEGRPLRVNVAKPKTERAPRESRW